MIRSRKKKVPSFKLDIGNNLFKNYFTNVITILLQAIVNLLDRVVLVSAWSCYIYIF
jgi:hypothetical protein